ncbi:MAG: hypothetical protein K8T91_05445 [Planctomycetes bacterium]|nr:hypothetical protein [Planctomycetota bacterium]
MALWFPSSRLARTAFAFLATASVAGWSSSAPASVLLISLPNGETDIQNASNEVWPWAPESTGDAEAENQGNRPTVGLAPELSMAEAAVAEEDYADQEGYEAVTVQPWAASLGAEPSTTGSLLSSISAALTQCDGLQELVHQNQDAPNDSIAWSFQNRALGLLSFPIGATARNAWGEAFARWGQHGSELREALCDQGVLYRLFRASIEAEQIALIENHTEPEVAAQETRLEPAPTVAASAHLPATVTPTRLRLFILTRPLVRSAAEMLNQAGGSLQNAAAQLNRISEADPAPANDPPATSESSLNEIPGWNETTAIPHDPAAAEFFGF